MLNFEVDCKDILGTGTFSVVYRGKIIESGDAVAVKRIEKQDMMVTVVTHENVCKLLFCTCDDNFTYIVTKLYHLNLEDVCKNNIRDVDDSVIFKCLIKSLFFLMDNDIIHTSLQPSNIFIENGIAKLSCDYLFKKRYLKPTETGCTMNHVWLAPETMSTLDTDDPFVDRKSNIFSMGCIMYAFLYRSTGYCCPFGNLENYLQVMVNKKNGTLVLNEPTFLGEMFNIKPINRSVHHLHYFL